MSVTIGQVNNVAAGAVPKKKKLAAIRKWISGFFEFLATIVIFTLFVASVDITIQVLTPGGVNFTLWGLPAGAMLKGFMSSVMSVSIEAAMCGCSVIARNAKKKYQESNDKDEKAKQYKYNSFGFLFFCLFLTTMAFSIFNIDEQTVKYLELVRCAAAGLYAYLCHGEEDDEEQEEARTIKERIEAIVKQSKDQLEQDIKSTLHALEVNFVQEKLEAEAKKIEQKILAENEKKSQNFSQIFEEKIIRKIEIFEEKIPQILEENFPKNLVEAPQKNFDNFSQNFIPETPQSFLHSQASGTYENDTQSQQNNEVLHKTNAEFEARVERATRRMEEGINNRPSPVGALIDDGLHYAQNRGWIATPQNEQVEKNIQQMINSEVNPVRYAQKRGWIDTPQAAVNERVERSASSTQATDAEPTTDKMKASQSSEAKGYTQEDILKDSRVIALFPTPKKREKAVNDAIATGALLQKSDGKVRENGLKNWIKSCQKEPVKN